MPRPPSPAALPCVTLSTLYIATPTRGTAVKHSPLCRRYPSSPTNQPPSQYDGCEVPLHLRPSHLEHGVSVTGASCWGASRHMSVDAPPRSDGMVAVVVVVVVAVLVRIETELNASYVTEKPPPSPSTSSSSPRPAAPHVVLKLSCRLRQRSRAALHDRRRD